MSNIRAYTYIAEQTLVGATLDVAHNVYQDGGIGHAEQVISITPRNAGGVGTWLSNVADNSLRLNGTPGGIVRLQVRGVHSVAQ